MGVFAVDVDQFVIAQIVAEKLVLFVFYFEYFSSPTQNSKCVSLPVAESGQLLLESAFVGSPEVHRTHAHYEIVILGLCVVGNCIEFSFVWGHEIRKMAGIQELFVHIFLGSGFSLCLCVSCKKTRGAIS